MIDPGRFNYDRGAYERPNKGYVCGRAAEWGRPCLRGPNYDGTCGGVAECTPYNRNGRWLCRRSATEGSACDNGPAPDGTCGCTRPPCNPRRSLRHHRWRLSVIALGIVVAALAAFTHFSEDYRIVAKAFRTGALDPGPLTTTHSGFSSDQGCETCHRAHGAKSTGWLNAAFKSNDMSAACGDCHTFGGPAAMPHNTVFPKDKAVRQTECLMCHTEHKGGEADISGLTGAQCAVCHSKPFSTFDRSHPEFSERFPHFRRASIRYDHASHMGKYFPYEKATGKAPKNCTACHQTGTAQRVVEPLGFEVGCAACHEEQIVKRPLVVLRLPEFEESSLDRDAVEEFCGPFEDEAEEEFESISADAMSEVTAYLMNVPQDDPEEYSEAFQNLIMEMAETGTEPLVTMIKDSGVEVDPRRLFAGLNPEAAKRLACAWAGNLEYELPSAAIFGGWFGDLLELIYRPAGHADPVLKAWLDFAVAAGGEGGAADRADAMRQRLLSVKKGPGACIKCHAVSREAKDGPLFIEWQFFQGAAQVHKIFSHERHLDLVNPQGVKLSDPDRGCAFCHKLDVKADFLASFEDHDPYGFAANFAGMKKQACVRCHSENRVRQDCQLCHKYHKKPGFTERVTRNEK